MSGSRCTAGSLLRSHRRAIGASLFLLFAGPSALAECPAGEAHGLEGLRSLRAASFEMADAEARGRLALAFIDCLGDPRAEVRDDLAYSALSAWLRANALDGLVRESLLRALSERLSAPALDPLAGSFMALTLAEVARTDRVAPWMSAAQRRELVALAEQYLRSIRDRRGFDPAVGWRHAVAHGADLVAQLAANPAISGKQCERLLHALEVHVAPESGDAYVYGEPQRLARAASLIIGRMRDGENGWRDWLARVGEAPPGEWIDATLSTTGLAHVHNLKTFLQALYVDVHQRHEPVISAPVLQALSAQLNQLP